MFSILKSDLVNPFEPMEENLKQELKANIMHLLKANTSTFFNYDKSIRLDKSVALSLSVDEDCILCGAPWVDGLITEISSDGFIQWHAIEGAFLLAGDRVCTIHGKARDILQNEKYILDFLCFLSSIATYIQSYVKFIPNSMSILSYNPVEIPGFNLTQQYAARVGGGLYYESISPEERLITRNHIQIMGGVSAVLEQFSSSPVLDLIKMEVTSLQEVREVLKGNVKQIKLCYFSLEQIAEAVKIVENKAELEVFGNVYPSNIRQMTEMGILRIIIDDFAMDKHMVKYSLSYR